MPRSLSRLMTLAYVAPLTSRVKLGISVIVVPQRNGVVLAKELATLDRLCQGRLIVGVGAGWSEAEFQMLGVEIGSITVVRISMRPCGSGTTSGRPRMLPFAVSSTTCRQRLLVRVPFSRVDLPIWVGGSSVGARRRAGIFGAAWHPVGISASDLASRRGSFGKPPMQAGRETPEIAPRLPAPVRGWRAKRSPLGGCRRLTAHPMRSSAQLRDYEARV